MAFMTSSWCERRVRRSSAFEGKVRALFAPLQGVDRRGQAVPDVLGLIERHGDIHDRLVRRLYAALGPEPKQGLVRGMGAGWAIGQAHGEVSCGGLDLGVG